VPGRRRLLGDKATVDDELGAGHKRGSIDFPMRRSGVSAILPSRSPAEFLLQSFRSQEQSTR